MLEDKMSFSTAFVNLVNTNQWDRFDDITVFGLTGQSGFFSKVFNKNRFIPELGECEGKKHHNAA